MWDYSEKVKEHFFHPRNAKLVEHANARGDVGSISCGDALSLTLKVNPESDIIEDAGFQTFGCGSAIASSSALTEMIIGKTIPQALAVTNQDIATYLDGLPPEKMHCSVMGMEALHAAVADYRGETIEDTHEEGELICKCFAIDDLMIKRVVQANQLTTIEEVINYTKAGGACTSCHEKIEWVLDDCLAERAASSEGKDAVAEGLTEVLTEQVLTGQTLLGEANFNGTDSSFNGTDSLRALTGQTAEDSAPKVDEADQVENDRIWAVIEQVIAGIRPGVIADGGDLQLVDVDDNMVFIAMSGSCIGCGLSGLTLANLEQKISKALDRQYVVFPVQGNVDSHDQEKKEGTYNV